MLLLFGCTEQNEAPVVVNKPAGNYLYITFSEGPNQGRHKYVVGSHKGAGVSLKYNKSNNVTFFEAKGLVSEDGWLVIDSIRRFTKGALLVGQNRASDWLAKSPGNAMNCGRIEQRDHDNTQPFNTAFGIYKECGATVISSLSDWVDLGDGQKKARMVIGEFSDQVYMQMAMDDAPFQNFEAQIKVEFSITEQAGKE